MDRCIITSESDGNHKMELKHCREDDSGVYTAIAENVKGNTHCTAQLVVHECKCHFIFYFIDLRKVVDKLLRFIKS